LFFLSLISSAPRYISSFLHTLPWRGDAQPKQGCKIDFISAHNVKIETCQKKQRELKRLFCRNRYIRHHHHFAIMEIWKYGYPSWSVDVFIICCECLEITSWHCLQYITFKSVGINGLSESELIPVSVALSN
jgi:hypothetical protein